MPQIRAYLELSWANCLLVTKQEETHDQIPQFPAISPENSPKQKTSFCKSKKITHLWFIETKIKIYLC